MAEAGLTGPRENGRGQGRTALGHYVFYRAGV